MQVRALLVEAGRELAAAGVPDALLEARVLTGYALGLNRVQLITEATRDVAQEAIVRVRAAVARRASGEPLAHITGQREFYGRPFHVTQHTLVPRPETELLVEESLRRLPRGGCFADWGTGSGCVGITLAAERPDCPSAGLQRRSPDRGPEKRAGAGRGDATPAGPGRHASPLSGQGAFQRHLQQSALYCAAGSSGRHARSAAP